MDEEKILEAIAALSLKVTDGFNGMEHRFSEIENRLGIQEKKTKLQDDQIEELKRIVLDLAKTAPLKTYDDAAAISKEDAYQKFAEKGVGKVTAMRALRKTGIVKLDPEEKNTRTIYFNGACKRVIIVNLG